MPGAPDLLYARTRKVQLDAGCRVAAARSSVTMWR